MTTGGGTYVDLVVVGGGPAGSTLAALVAMQGHRVMLLEKESFPRYQIGESLLPSTVHGICRLTGAADDIAAAGFMRKHGGTFQWGASPDPWTFSFALSPKTAGPTSFAYQVERMKFDQILLKNAARQGAEVREECLVTGVHEDGGRVTGVRYLDHGRERHVYARYVADASGHTGRLHSSVGGIRKYSEFFRNLALFGYFENGRRLDGDRSGNILCVAFDAGWFWYIPLTDTLTSVGAVVRNELASKVQGDPHRTLLQLVADCPLIKEFLADADRVTDGPYGKLRVRKDWSYHQTAFWRPGIVCIGDSACFVDPVFSSGVHLATYSGLLAARSINSCLAGMLDENSAFKEFENRYRREFGVFYQFLSSFYRTHVDKNSYFWSAKNVTSSEGSDEQAFVELVGGLSSREFDLSNRDAAGHRFGGRSAEFSAAVSEISRDPEENMMPLFESTVVRQAMREASQVQTRALRGKQLGPEPPLFDDGLAASPDGMFWVRPG